MPVVAEWVEAAGHTITERWWEYPETSDHDLLEACAQRDYTGVVKADALLLLNTQARGSETSGKAVETGIAIAMFKPVILVGERTNVFHHLPNVHVVATVDEALELLA